MTDIYERLADENEPAPATAPAAQLTGDQASNLMASLTVEDSDATTILAALAGPIQAGRAHRTVDIPVRVRSTDLPRPHGKRVFAGTHRQIHADPRPRLETGIHEIQYQYPATSPDRLQTLDLIQNAGVIGMLSVHGVPPRIRPAHTARHDDSARGVRRCSYAVRCRSGRSTVRRTAGPLRPRRRTSRPPDSIRRNGSPPWTSTRPTRSWAYPSSNRAFAAGRAVNRAGRRR